MTHPFFFIDLASNVILNHVLFGLGLLLVSIICTKIMLDRVRVIDVPNQRSSHTVPTPKSGGISIVVTFFVGLMAIYFLGDATHIKYLYFGGFGVSALVIAVVALYDDIQYKGYNVKLLSQILSACVLLAFGIVFDQISLPGIGAVSLGIWGYFLTLFWVVGLTNTFNFMDGIDGLAGGTAVLVSFFLGIITLSQGSNFVYINCYTILAGSLGFLVFNFPPARIFMGDVGSAFLGFVFAALAIIAASYDHSHTSFFVVPLLLFNFIFDTSFTFCRRLLRGDQVTQAHRTHLYQLFTRIGYSHKQVTLFHYFVTIMQGIGAIFMIHLVGDLRVLVFLPYLMIRISPCSTKTLFNRSLPNKGCRCRLLQNMEKLC